MPHRALRFAPACFWLLLVFGCANPPPARTTSEAAPSGEAPSAAPAPNTAKEPQQYEVRIETFTELPTAVIKEVAYKKNIGPTIMSATGQVYQALEVSQAPKQGANIVLYLPFTTDGSWTAPPGIPIEVGVVLTDPPETLSPPLVRSSLPGGRVAVTTHYGRYQALDAAHEAIQQYVAAQGLAVTWRNWEIYGPWMDNPAERRTDVYYLLK